MFLELFNCRIDVGGVLLNIIIEQLGIKKNKFSEK